ncbi:hypothetical protein SOVF_175640 [Spinacia oleracea]|nr:hypothetical protein SOVF_175640 [Spinacia oleracea]
MGILSTSAEDVCFVILSVNLEATLSSVTFQPLSADIVDAISIH